MRVLQTIAARDWGGIAYRTVEQALWLNRHGHQCWLASPGGSEVALRARKAGVPVVEFNFDRPFCPTTIGRLRRLVEQLDCQVIETHTGRCANAAMFARDRCAVLRARHTTQRLKPTLARYLRWRYGWDWTVATAEVIADELIGSHLVPESRITVIGEWVADRYFQRAEWPGWRQQWRQRLGLADDVFVVGAVGMLRPEKAFDDLIRAVAVMRDNAHENVVAVIAGEVATAADTHERDLRALAESLGVAPHIRFVGYQDDIPGLLQAFDAVAVPSTFEAQSRIIPEALASERPVVASRVGGIAEVIDHGVNGWLVWPGDPVALASHLFLVRNDAVSTAMICREAGRVATSRLSIDRKMAEYLALYRQVLSRRPSLSWAMPEAEHEPAAYDTGKAA